jgi:hypothetical protein
MASGSLKDSPWENRMRQIMRENQAGPNRRSFLRNAGLAGVGTTALGALGVAPAEAGTAGCRRRANCARTWT